MHGDDFCKDFKEAWEECVKMWKWLVEKVERDEMGINGFQLITLKERYLRQAGYGHIFNDCFFCAFSKLYSSKCGESWFPDFILEGCLCPAKLVDGNFECMVEEYDYSRQPEMFYKALKVLYKNICEQLGWSSVI